MRASPPCFPPWPAPPIAASFPNTNLISSTSRNCSSPIAARIPAAIPSSSSPKAPCSKAAKWSSKAKAPMPTATKSSAASAKSSATKLGTSPPNSTTARKSTSSTRSSAISSAAAIPMPLTHRSHGLRQSRPRSPPEKNQRPSGRAQERALRQHPPRDSHRHQKGRQRQGTVQYRSPPPPIRQLRNAPSLPNDQRSGIVSLPISWASDAVCRGGPIYVLGIDVGTGGTRAIVIDGHARVISSATEEHQPFASPQIGWAEQHPEDWWRASCVAVRKAIASANLSAEEIACVGFSGQMHGAVLLDEQGTVVRPALIWCDVRTEKQRRDLTSKIGQERLIQLTCNPALANFTLTKLLWVRENEPEHWKRVRSVMLPKDYVRFRLTCERATAMADAP